MSIIVRQVSKRFGSFQALDKINLEVKKGKLVALLGPSGSGKSTLLRAIAGLEKPDTGSVIINGRDTTNLDIKQRNIGFVFQHYALFKHLTVRQNIAFGLEIRKHGRKGISEKVEELLGLIQLQGLGDRYPAQLSGGQRQRVALARALAVQPQVLLLDEPFGALDAKVRKELRAWVRRLHDEIHLTSVFVTHDQEEAMEVADEIVVMNQGRIEQVGSPDEIYDNPATPFVMSFIGDVNILPSHSNLIHMFPEQWNKSVNHSQSTPLQVFVRPHELDIFTLQQPNTLSATIKRITHLGREVQIELELAENVEILANVSREQMEILQLRLHQEVFVKSRKAKLFPASNLELEMSVS